MHVVVVHDYGPLGRVLLERLRDTPLQISPLLVSDPDKADLSALEEWIPGDTDLIVNALWLTDPETAERDPEGIRKAAFSLPIALAEFARDRDMALFQLSSCYVFDGRKQNAYISSNPGHPSNELGNWQWECEQALRALLPHHIILRTGWSLGRFIRKVQQGTGPGDTLRLPGRCRGQPVTVRDLARVMKAVILQLDCGAEVWGTYQYAGAEEISLYELGLAIAGLPGIPNGIRVVDDMPKWAALEPVNATLICTKIRNTFGIKQLPWRSGLTDELEALSSVGGKQPTDTTAH
ncbi:dTDP-4-dehydrorhamnose reductase-like protein [Marinobacter lipolyticus SM19]|uniref:dTDP-4-dehydrorhamnose reductase n=1 Tax=Marinobacter lipolyticus SM19 TaxID=1318628 RepID=R8AYX3_9GAMM|nr:sugar nucleotide-binding protein [Marinobacter lipolyticus]EON91548.1 dTDP-4-dehydrorhamnose reductase-like protein [Marinobacter lipolyticus SM19]